VRNTALAIQLSALILGGMRGLSKFEPRAFDDPRPQLRKPNKKRQWKKRRRAGK
jgi:hypothetical protein